MSRRRSAHDLLDGPCGHGYDACGIGCIAKGRWSGIVTGNARGECHEGFQSVAVCVGRGRRRCAELVETRGYALSATMSGLKRYTVFRGYVIPVVLLVGALTAERCDLLPLSRQGSAFVHVAVIGVGVLSLVLPGGVAAILWPAAFFKRGQRAPSHGALVAYGYITQHVPSAMQDISFCLFILRPNLYLFLGLLVLSIPIVYVVSLHNRAVFRRYNVQPW